MRKPILFLALLALSLSSCKKDDNDDIAIDGLTLLKTGTWKPSSVDLNTTTNPIGKNTYYARPDCESDDSYSFKDNSQLSIDRGQKKCSDMEKSPDAVTYTLDLNLQRISINNVTYNLTEISKNQLKFYKPTQTTDGNNIVYVFQH